MGKHQFYDYSIKHIDKDSQYTERLNDLEEFIMKPQNSQKGIYSLTEEEIKIYMSIDTKKLRKTDMNMKTIIICKATQELIRDNMENILKKIENEKGEENENER